MVADTELGEHPPRLLAVCYGGGHVAAVVPVLRELIGRGWSCDTLALTTAQERLAAQGLPWFGFADLLTDSDTAARQYGEGLAASVTNSRIPHAETVAYLGLSFAELVNELGELGASQRFETLGRAAFLPVEAVTRAVARVRPTVILTTNSPRAERAALHASRDLAVPSVAIIDLFGANDDAWVPEFPGTTFCVLGQAVVDRFVRAGASPSQLTVTGNPAFDELHSQASLTDADHVRAGLGAILGTEADQPLVLCAVPPGHEDQFVPWILSALKDAPVVLCLRQHPSSGLTTWITTHEGQFECRDHLGASLPAWLHAADLVISTGSTLSLQAVLTSTPTILIEGWGQLGFAASDLAPWAPCTTVEGPESLRRAAVEFIVEASTPSATNTSGTTATRVRQRVPSAAELVADVIELRASTSIT